VLRCAALIILFHTIYLHFFHTHSQGSNKKKPAYSYKLFYFQYRFEKRRKSRVATAES